MLPLLIITALAIATISSGVVKDHDIRQLEIFSAAFEDELKEQESRQLEIFSAPSKDEIKDQEKTQLEISAAFEDELKDQERRQLEIFSAAFEDELKDQKSRQLEISSAASKDEIKDQGQRQLEIAASTAEDPAEYGRADAMAITALGRPFEIGYLYNKKSDTLIDVNLWNLTQFTQETVSHKSSVYSDWKVLADDTVVDRVNNMELDVQLKMSIMGGLIKIKGMASYLENRKQNSRVSSLTLTTKKRSCTLKMGPSLLRNPTYKNWIKELADAGATHVVTGITYGADAFFSFSKQMNNQENEREIKGMLGVSIDSIPSLSISGEANMTIANEEKEFRESLKVEFYGDYDVTPPSDFKGAVRALKDIFERSDNNGPDYHPCDEVNLKNDVPKEVSLTPLSLIISGADNLLLDISKSAVEKAAQIRQYFENARLQLGTLLLYQGSIRFPRYHKFIKAVRAHFQERETAFTMDIGKILPEIRGGGASERALLQLVSDVEQSMYGADYFEPWVKEQAREVRLFEVVWNLLDRKDIQLHIATDYEQVLEHVVGAGRQGLFVLEACLVSRADLNLLSRFKEKDQDNYIYPVNPNYWANRRYDNFHDTLFKRVHLMRHLAELNEDKANAVEYLAYFSYMCDENMATVNFMRGGRIEYTNVDIGVDLRNFAVDEQSEKVGWDMTANLKDTVDDIFRVQVQYDHYIPKDNVTYTYTVKEELPDKLPPGFYTVHARPILPGGVVGDWTERLPFIIKECEVFYCKECHWNGKCKTCLPGYNEKDGQCQVSGANWSRWSDFTPCSKSCGEGSKTRWRTCQVPPESGIECAGEAYHMVPCARHSCHPLQTNIEKIEGKCFPFSELTTRGFAYDVCPFKNVSQTCVFQNEFSMGQYVGWDTRDPKLTMTFIGGTFCDEPKEYRSTTVKFHCGSEDKIVNIWEPMSCRYTIHMEVKC